MIADVAQRLLWVWLACAAGQGLLWAIQQRTRNAGIVDVGWAGLFTVAVAMLAATASSAPSAWTPIALVVLAWSVRLTTYLISRGAASGPEEGRYVDLRQRWGERASRRFFVFFQAQGALVAFLSLSFVVPFVSTPWDHGALRGAGVALGMTGVLGEAVADAQLARFKRAPHNKGKVCDVGLWGWSRHPNYFFEWCVWIGHAVYGLAFAPWGLVALLGQALVLASIFGVTGIPPTEAQALRSKGDAYRDYQRRVSRFLPMPPRRASPEEDRSGDA